MLVWLSVWSEVQTCIWPSWCYCHSLSLASVILRLVLPFWYRLTWVVPEKGLLNVCLLSVCLSDWLIDKLCMLTYSTAIGNFSHYWYCSVFVCNIMFWAMSLYWSATIFMPHSWFLSSLLQQTTSKLCSQYDFCSLFCSVVILQWIEMKLGKCGFLFWHVYIPGIHSMYHFYMTDWQRLEMLLLTYAFSMAYMLSHYVFPFVQSVVTRKYM